MPVDKEVNDRRLARMKAGPGLLCQTLLCMIFMILNNVIWVRRRRFSTAWHTLHYFVAAFILMLYLPRKNWWPAMTGIKYMYTAMNIFIF